MKIWIAVLFFVAALICYGIAWGLGATPQAARWTNAGNACLALGLAFATAPIQL